MGQPILRYCLALPIFSQAKTSSGILFPEVLKSRSSWFSDSCESYHIIESLISYHTYISYLPMSHLPSVLFPVFSAWHQSIYFFYLFSAPSHHLCFTQIFPKSFPTNCFLHNYFPNHFPTICFLHKYFPSLFPPFVFYINISQVFSHHLFFTQIFPKSFPTICF